MRPASPMASPNADCEQELADNGIDSRMRRAHLKTGLRTAARRDPIVAWFALACAPAAWASYAQMRLDGLAFILAVIALFAWAVMLSLALAARLGRYPALVIAATVATAALTLVLVYVFADGRATMRPRPLTGPAMFVVLLLAAVPVMLAAPFLQLAARKQAAPSTLPIWLLGAAVTLVPLGSILYAVVQDQAGERVLARTRGVPAGQVQPHVDASLRHAANSWLAPYLWNEEAEAKWLILGLSQAGGIADRPAPLAAGDAQAVASLVGSAAGNSNLVYTGKLEGKLVWDRLMGAPPADRPAVAGGLSKQEVRQFKEYVVIPHADWLCTPLADPATERAIVRLAAQLREDERPEFAAKIGAACGRTLPAR